MSSICSGLSWPASVDDNGSMPANVYPWSMKSWKNACLEIHSKTWSGYVTTALAFKDVTVLCVYNGNIPRNDKFIYAILISEKEAARWPLHKVLDVFINTVTKTLLLLVGEHLIHAHRAGATLKWLLLTRAVCLSIFLLSLRSIGEVLSCLRAVGNKCIRQPFQDSQRYV